jgi:putative nucleotidyltransferase with HDIG domain
VSPIAQFLTAFGQALAAMGLYAAGHPMRAASRERALAALRVELAQRGAVQVTFLDREVVVGTRALPELRGWDWGVRLAQAGLPRLEIDAEPAPTDEEFAELLTALDARLTTPAAGADPLVRCGALRAGPVHVLRALANGASDAPEDVFADVIVTDDERVEVPALDEEAGAVRWIHDEAANGRPIPLAEVVAVVWSLSAAMRRDGQLVLPRLEPASAEQYLTTHACNVSILSMALAEQVGLGAKEVRAIGVAALLHDIGKVRVSPDLLVLPGPLAEAEFAAILQHAPEGARLLTAQGRGFELAAVVAYEHHRWADGSRGYPALVYPRPAHLASRLVRVCDLVDALRSPRPFRQAWSRERALARLAEAAGSEVDAALAHAFVRLATTTPERRLPIADAPRDDWTATLALASTRYR